MSRLLIQCRWEVWTHRHSKHIDWIVLDKIYLCNITIKWAMWQICHGVNAKLNWNDFLFKCYQLHSWMSVEIKIECLFYKLHIPGLIFITKYEIVVCKCFCNISSKCIHFLVHFILTIVVNIKYVTSLGQFSYFNFCFCRHITLR